MNKMNDHLYTILIVDDILENLSFLSEFLDSLNYSVTFAKNGEEAIQSVNKNKPDLILLDLRMPVMSGLQFLKIFKKDPNYQNIPIIVLTASKEETDLIKAFELGANDYVTKPFKTNELLIRVKHQLIIYQQGKDIKEKNLELELANQKLENFNRMVCHDIMNPLTNIKGFNYILQEELTNKLTPQQQEFFTCIDLGVNQILEIIESLIILSQVKKLDLSTLYPLNISDMVTEILSAIKTQNRDRQSEFIIQKDIVVNGQKQLLQIGLENILNNSWKYSSKKEKTIIQFGTMTKDDLIKNQVDIPLDISENLDEEQTIYFIQDNGAGFNQKHVDQMFEVFQRLHTTDEFPGTGIGLAIVERVITCLGGKIWANGIIDKGATVYFLLPIAV